MKQKHRVLTVLTAVLTSLILFAVIGCPDSGSTDPVKSAAKAITAFALVIDGVDLPGVIDEAAKTIVVAAASDTNFTDITARITHTGKSISPDPTAARDYYPNPVEFTVTAENGSTVKYTVTVRLLGSTATLNQFAVTDTAGTSYQLTPPFAPDQTDVTDFNLLVPMDTAALTLTAAVSDNINATLDKPTQTIEFTEGSAEVTVTVTSEDGKKTVTFTLRVTKTANMPLQYTVGDKSFRTFQAPAGKFSRDGGNTNITIITKPYRMAETEVTVGLFNEVMGKVQDAAGTWVEDTTYTTPTSDSAGKYPQRDGSATNAAGQMNFFAAVAFLNKLSVRLNKTPVYSIDGISDWGKLTWAQVLAVSVIGSTDTGAPSGAAAWNNVTCNWDANGFRLPTEMEWIWAALGAGYGLTPDATGVYKPENLADVFAGKELGKTFAECVASAAGQVAQLAPNVLGLYDLCGNVGEIVWDRGSGGAKTWTGELTDFTNGTDNTTGRRVKGGGGTQSEANRKNYTWGDSVVTHWMRWGSNGFRIASND